MSLQILNPMLFQCEKLNVSMREPDRIFLSCGLTLELCDGIYWATSKKCGGIIF
jgi:hypothetical protein